MSRLKFKSDGFADLFKFLIGFLQFEIIPNFFQRRSRQVVERYFALLKTKFRRLKCIYVHNLEYLSAACCLHN